MSARAFREMATIRATPATWRALASIVVLVLVLGLLTHNLPDWPVIWYDEGYSLQAAKNLTLLGRYGLQGIGGFREFDPLLTTGPTVVGPIALAFSMLGIDLIWARLVIVGFAVTALLSIFWLARRVFDLKTAIVACLLVLASPPAGEDISASFIGLSRMVMGEVPALALVLIGILLWFRAIDRDNLALSAGSGLVFGLAVITKPQCLLAVPAIGLAWVVDRLWYRQVRWAHFALPAAACLAGAALWYAYPSYVSGSGPLDPVGFSERFGTHLAFLTPSQIVRNLRTLLASGALTWGLPGLFYGLYVSRARSLLGFQRAFLIVFCISWLSWFVLGSIGWLRYAFLALAIAGILSARLLVDLADGFSVPWRALRNPGHSERETGRAARTLAVSAAIALMVLTPLQRTLREIIAGDGRAPFEFAGYLDANVPDGAGIASFEAEISFLSSHQFHTPSLAQEGAAIRHVQMDIPYPPGSRVPDDLDLAYIVDGPMSKWTELYAEELRTGGYLLVVSIGPYDLYRAAEAAAPEPP